MNKEETAMKLAVRLENLLQEAEQWKKQKQIEEIQYVLAVRAEALKNREELLNKQNLDEK